MRTVDSHGAVEPATLLVLVNTARHETVLLALTKMSPTELPSLVAFTV